MTGALAMAFPECFFFCFWGLATLALRLPSPQEGLTAHLASLLARKTDGMRDLKPVCWRRPTLAFRLPSAQKGLTAVFGMRTGVSPSPNHQHTTFKSKDLPVENEERHKNEKTCIAKQCLRDSHNSFREFCRGISTPRLNALLHLHLAPINVVISHGPITIPYLGVGFPLRCFQRLSEPDIATGRCYWCNSPQTRGRFISVLSY